MEETSEVCVAVIQKLTPATDCDGCLRLERRIKDLEVRILLLHNIHEDELFLDALQANAATGCTSDISRGREPEDSLPGPVPGCQMDRRTELWAMDPLSKGVPVEEAWPVLGAKPKRPDTTKAEVWIPAPCSRRKRDRQAASPPISLGNSFQPLAALLDEHQSSSSPRAKRTRSCTQALPRDMDNSPPHGDVVISDRRRRAGKCADVVGDVDPSLPSEDPVPDRRGRTGVHRAQVHHAAFDVGDVDPLLLSEAVVPDRRGRIGHCARPGARRASIRSAAVPLSGRAVRPAPMHTRSPTPPTVLIIGDSTVRNLRVSHSLTYCYPGATTQFILDRLPLILASIPHTISQVVLQVGINDRHQSIKTRDNFKNILDLLLSCGKQIFVSGPFPLLRRGEVRFSQLLDLHYWLQSVCSSCGINYIHNFHLFWARPDFYAHDGLHPSGLGNNSLSFHIKRVLTTNAQTSGTAT